MEKEIIKQIQKLQDVFIYNTNTIEEKTKEYDRSISINQENMDIELEKTRDIIKKYIPNFSNYSDLFSEEYILSDNFIKEYKEYLQEISNHQ